MLYYLPRSLGLQKLDVENLYNLFEEQVTITPSTLALISENTKISFSELQEMVDGLYYFLSANNVSNKDVVGIYGSGGIELIVSILATLKLGAIYMPLDDTYPSERLAYMVDHSECKYVITISNELPFKTKAKVISFSSVDKSIASEKKPPSFSNSQYAPACLIYTSGSTGKPKGVLISHDSLINRLQWMWKEFPYIDEEICVLKTAICFVDSLAEIFSPLLQGVTLAIPEKNIVKDPANFLKFLFDYNVTRIVLVPSFLSVLTQYNNLSKQIPKLYFWVVSGETLSLQLAKKFKAVMPHARLINLYGSTEVTADVTYHEVSNDDFNKGVIPIGRVIDNNHIFILDEKLNILPSMEEGEIVVVGRGLAIGYLKDTNNDKFTSLSINGTRIPAFRTGDLGKYTPDGDLLYKGRNDGQIKISGKRVNLLEIEMAIKEEFEVEQCIIRTINEGKLLELVAFIKAANFEKEAYRGRLANKLPTYMIPAHCIKCDSFPLLPNGKVDREALSNVFKSQKVKAKGVCRVQDSLQLSIASIIETEFNISEISVTDSFFELGITSLEIAKLSVLIQNNLGLKISVPEIVNHASVKELCKYLQHSNNEAIDYKKLTILPIKVTPENTTNLFIFHPITGLALPYLKLKDLSTTYNIYAISNPFFGKINKFTSIKEMAAYYAKLLIEAQSSSEFNLAGWSFGGTIALEVANYLIDAGFRVANLIMIDTFNFHHAINMENQLSLDAELKNEIDWLENEQKVNINSAEGHIFKQEIIANITLLYNYMPRCLLDQMSLIKADTPEPVKYPVSIDDYNGWGSVFHGNISRHIIQGKHDKLFRPEHITKIADILNKILSNVPTTHDIFVESYV